MEVIDVMMENDSDDKLSMRLDDDDKKNLTIIRERLPGIKKKSQIMKLALAFYAKRAEAGEVNV
jgi:hypothetical protein